MNQVTYDVVCIEFMNASGVQRSVQLLGGTAGFLDF